MLIDDEVLNITILKREVTKYLKDAGFNEKSYQIVEYSGREYVEIVGFEEKAINFILDDLKKTKWYDVISLKHCKYEGEDGIELSMIALFA